MLFDPCVSHYCKKHAPNHLYIYPLYSSRKMYTDFVENHSECNISHTRYFQILKSMNIGFVKLGDEECVTCDLNDRHLIDVHGLEDEKERSQLMDTDDKKFEKIFFTNCCECSEYALHIEFAKKARMEYRADHDREWNEGEQIYSADLQKVIMLPAMPGLKKAIFCKHIVMFDETFATVGGKKNGDSAGVLWHKGIEEELVEMLLVSLLRF